MGVDVEDLVSEGIMSLLRYAPFLMPGAACLSQPMRDGRFARVCCAFLRRSRILFGYHTMRIGIFKK